MIISCGGGVILREENIISLKQNGIVIYIDRDLDKLAVSDDRPLSKNRDALKALYEKRKDLYKKYADIRIENNGCVKEVIEKINELICN